MNIKNKHPAAGLSQVFTTAISFAVMLCVAALWSGHGIISAVMAQDMWDNPNDQAGALSRENLDKPRPPAPIDLTGTWLIDFSTWMFNPLPRLKPAYQKTFEQATKA